jgi:hypothetical protein
MTTGRATDLHLSSSTVFSSLAQLFGGFLRFRYFYLLTRPLAITIVLHRECRKQDTAYAEI